MSVQQLLYTMCADLPDADLNAIRKSRRFGASETASRTSFASFYMSSVGLVEAAQALAVEEILTLRLLHEAGEVDVAFFERLYGAGNPSGTYTQRYKPTFDAVKKFLVRRGLVVMAEVKMRGETVQLQRWRFALPSEFIPFLPPLPAVQNDQSGQTDERMVRLKLLQLVSAGQAVPKDRQTIAIKAGSLYLNEKLFTITTLNLWQMAAWESAMEISRPNVPASVSAIEAVLKLLSPDRWTNPKTLGPALKIYCFGEKVPPADKLLHKGWELGLLARLEIGSIDHYRLVTIPNPAAGKQAYPTSLEWADRTSRPGCLKIDLRQIPLLDLEQLNSLTHLKLEKESLFASPSLVKLGRSTPAQRGSMLARWLTEHVPAFGSALETVNAKWGKTVLHENLLVARVRDLSLRVQLERELKDNIVVLSEHFIAFPLEARASVEKILKKTGFVVKTVKP